MNVLKKLDFISYFTVIALLGVGGLLTLSSCTDKNDEPTLEKPGGENSSDNEDTDKDVFELPQDFPASYSFGYVKLIEGMKEQYKEYTGFALSFNEDNHTPNYVAWELLSEETTGSANRSDYDFWQDRDLRGCPTKDYAYSVYKYERGHMCPAADQKWSGQAMKDCFVMANMCPQLGELNGKAWEKLEEKERAWAKRDKAIWIVAGPIYYDTDELRIGFSQVRVPSAFFKAFLYINTDEPRAIAFIYPNMESPGNMEDYAMSIDDLEKETGYDFFPALPDEIEDKIEATYSFSDWNK